MSIAPTPRIHLSFPHHPSRLALHGARTVLVVCTWLGTMAAASTDDSRPLRYGWKQGQSLVYNVRVEVDRGDYLEVLSGTPSYHVVSADQDNIKFNFVGTLMERTEQKPGKNRIVIGRPPIRPPFSSLTGVGSGGPPRGHEITINPRGEIVSMQGSSQLPFLLGNLSELMLDPLPEKDEKTWSHAKDTAIAISNSILPRPIFRDDDRKLIKATAKTTFRLEELADDTATIRKVHELRTSELVNGKPRFEITGSGPITFDLKQGTPVAIDFDQKLIVREGNTAEETGLKITYKLLDEAELAKLKATAEAQKKEAERPLDAGEIDTLVADLTSNKVGQPLRALQSLQGKSPTEPNPEVSKALESLLTHKDQTIRFNVAKALETWATSENVPALLMALDDQFSLTRHSAMKALARAKPDEAAEPIAKHLGELQDRLAASAALKSLGTTAEPAVFKQLEHKDWQVRLEAVRILQEIGTSKCTAALKTAKDKDEQILVRNIAGQAIEAIEKRGK